MIFSERVRAAASPAAVSIFLLATLVSCATAGRPATIAPADGDDPATLASAEVPTGPLPRDVVPTAYNLEMVIFPGETHFTGEVSIAVRVLPDCTEDCSLTRIWLHGRGIEALQAEVRPAEGEPIAARYHQHDEEGVVSLDLGRPLAAGDATIFIRYRAPFDDALRGLYRVEAGGDHYAFTQFEATSARQAFPCFDEPGFKVPFTASFVVEDEDFVAFNTPVDHEETLDYGVRRVSFVTTPPLPTYLVAMAVGPFDVVEGPTLAPTEVRERAVPFRGLAVRGKGEQLAFALERTGRIVEALEAYFGIPYPYRKLDIVAVPDFAAGAMENAGLITFREPLLLLNAESPEGQRRGFAYVMAHELAHQWFGNYVTMEWWDDLWLNEAFATWMGWKITGEVFPEQRADLSLLSGVHRAMGSDSLISARQIRQPIETHHDISSAFDSITYRKGSGVLGMMESYVGPEQFREAIRSYLREHAWGNAVGDDLVAAIDARAPSPGVGVAMRSFLDQPGLPVVSTRLSCADGRGTVRFSQSRYLPRGSEGDAEASSWEIPLCFRYQPAGEESARRQCAMIRSDPIEVELAGGCATWLHPNADAAGYYRFAFPEDAASLAALVEHADDTSEVERAGLADSVNGAFRAALIEFDDVLEISGRFAAMTPRAVASAPMSMLGFVHERVADESERAVLESRIRDMYGERAESLGLAPREGESGEDALLRTRVHHFLATRGEDPDTRAALAARGNAALGGAGDGLVSFGELAAELEGVALRMAIEEGDAHTFDRVLSIFRQETEARRRYELLAALGATRDPALRERALALALDPALRVNELRGPLGAALSTPEGRDAVWTFVRENFDALDERLGGSSARLIGLAGAFCSEERAAEVEAFYGERVESMGGGPRALAGTLESIRLCARLAEAHSAGVSAALAR